MAGVFRIAGAVALLCLIWGTTWSVIQIGLEGIPPFTGVAVRFAIAGSLLLGIALARGIDVLLEWDTLATAQTFVSGYQYIGLAVNNTPGQCIG